MQPLPPNRLLAVLLFAVAAIAVGWVYHHRDRMDPIAPRVVLSRNCGEWSLLYDPHATPGGAPTGGFGLAHGLTGVERIDSYVIGATAAGEHFILTLRDLRRDEYYEELIERFPPGQRGQWLARCQALGMTDPRLRPPEAVARSPRPH